MSLVRWFRKYNKKLMAFVVIILMFIFIMPTTMKQLGSGPGKEMIGYIYGTEKITTKDLAQAEQELAMLAAMGGSTVLQGIIIPMTRTPDLRYFLLGELIFEDKAQSEVSSYLKNMIVQENLGISEKMISDLYMQQHPKYFYWLLLSKEAHMAGFRISNDEARQTLEAVIPQIQNNQTSIQVISYLMQQFSVSENTLYEAFGKLLAVMKYAEAICANENLTNSQLSNFVSLQGETMDVNFVKFDASVFVDNSWNPSDDAVKQQFEKYKNYFPGEISDQNPYGFGYKIPDAVKLDYIALKVDDLKKITPETTEEEMQDYYEKNRNSSIFKEMVPEDPNDPNSEKVELLKSYSQVEPVLSQGLYQRKLSVKAEEIFREAKAITEAKLTADDTDASKLTAEEYKKMAGDYNAAAQQLSQKFSIPVYSGQTGFLSAYDIQADQKLSNLFEQPAGKRSVVSLLQLAFSVEELAGTNVNRLEISKQPKMFENIGPLKDVGNIYALLRVVDIKKSQVPDDLNYTYDNSSIILGGTNSSAKTLNVKNKVIDDLRKFSAINKARQKADEFIIEALSGSWKKTVDKFNALYKPKNTEVNEPNAFALKELTRVQRMSKEYIQSLEIATESSPLAASIINNALNQEKFGEQLFSLIPADAAGPEKLPLVMEFKPELSWYAVKDLKIRRFYQDEFIKIKNFGSFKQGINQSQVMAFFHYNPDAIVNRTQFKAIEKKKDLKTEPNVPKDKS